MQRRRRPREVVSLLKLRAHRRCMRLMSYSCSVSSEHRFTCQCATRRTGKALREVSMVPGRSSAHVSQEIRMQTP